MSDRTDEMPPKEPCLLTFGFYLNGTAAHLRVQDADRLVVFDVEVERTVIGDLLSGRSEVPATLQRFAPRQCGHLTMGQGCLLKPGHPGGHLSSEFGATLAAPASRRVLVPEDYDDWDDD